MTLKRASRARTSGGRFTVTGPALEGVSYHALGAAVSRAITESQRVHPTPAPKDGTWYVRDLDGTCLVRVENSDELTEVITLKKMAR